MKLVFEVLIIIIEICKNIFVLDNCVWCYILKMFKVMCFWSELVIVNLKLFNVIWFYIVVDFFIFLIIRVIMLDVFYDVNMLWW